jgi:hypothetical protein
MLFQQRIAQGWNTLVSLNPVTISSTKNSIAKAFKLVAFDDS